METRFLLEYQNKVGTAEQEIDNQAAMQRKLLDRDMAEIRRDWLQVE